MAAAMRTTLVVVAATMATATATRKSTAWGVVRSSSDETTTGNGAGFGDVSPAFAQGWYEEDHEAWGDLLDSRFVNVPQWLVGVTALVPGHRLPGKTLVEFHCPKKATVKTHTLEMCDAFVFLYRCPPCVVERAHLEQQLVAEGWTASGCGMDFKSGAAMGNGYSHRMMVLRKQFPADTTVSFTTADKVIDFAAFGASSFGADCGARKTEYDCNMVGTAPEKDGACVWDSTAKECVHTNFCRRPLGPHPGNGVPKCLVCPKEELAPVPVHPPAPSTR